MSNLRAHCIAGFTLIEVMVALIVLSIGLLGIAKMSLTSVQSNNSAYMRSQASVLIQEIIDNMHANRSQATSYAITYGQAAAMGTDCSKVTNCATTDLTAYDLAIWKTRLAAALPSGNGQIALATVTANGQLETTATVSVQWDDSVVQSAVGTPTGALQTLTVETML